MNKKPKRSCGAGLTENPADFLARHSDIVACLRAGGSLRATQAKTGKARNTVIKVKRVLGD